jgi:hypothetical protein
MGFVLLEEYLFVHDIYISEDDFSVQGKRKFIIYVLS